MSSARLDELPDWARDLLEGARVGRLGLIDDDRRPRVLPVTYALAGRDVWTAIDQKPKRVPGAELARVRWLRERPEATLTVDRYDDDWSRLAWVQVIGRIDIVDKPGPGVLEALRARYRQYVDRAPDGPFLALRPERLLHGRAGSGR